MKPTAIIKYILENAPVSHSSLEQRATTKHKMSLAQFDKLMVTVGKHYQISASVKGGDVWYKERSVRPKQESPVERFLRWSKENKYPEDPYKDEPEIFLLCHCHLFRTPEGEIFDPERDGHNIKCPAVTEPEEFLLQNRIMKRL